MEFISYTSWITQVKRSVRRRYQSATNLNKRKGGKHYPSSPLPFLFPSIHAKRIERSFAPPEQFRFFRTRGINEGFRHDNPLVLFIEMGMADKRAAHHVAFHLPSASHDSTVFPVLRDCLVRGGKTLFGRHIRTGKRPLYMFSQNGIAHGDQIIQRKRASADIRKTIQSAVSL